MSTSLMLLVVAGVLLLVGIVLGIYGIVRSRKDPKYYRYTRVAYFLCFGAAGFALLSAYAEIVMPHIK